MQVRLVSPLYPQVSRICFFQPGASALINANLGSKLGSRHAKLAIGLATPNILYVTTYMPLLYRVQI